MNAIPKIRYAFAPQPEELPPQQEPEAQMPDYQPQMLPELGKMQDLAELIARQARGIHNVGQMIVLVCQRNRENLVREASNMEQDRQQEIADVNRRYDALLQRNWLMIQDVDNMISFHTTEAPQQPDQQVIQPRTRRLRLFSKG